MRWTKAVLLGLVVSLAALVFVACGSFGPPESCPVAGAANQDAFDQNFTRMVVVKEGDPIPDTGGESDLTFSSGDRLELVAVTKGNVEALVCVGPRKAGVKITFNKAIPLTEGTNRVALESYVVNPYVVRISVNNVLVKNITFETK